MTQTLYVSLDCHHAVTGEIRYHPAGAKPGPGPFQPANPFEGPLVGTYTTKIPAR